MVGSNTRPCPITTLLVLPTWLTRPNKRGANRPKTILNVSAPDHRRVWHPTSQKRPPI